MTRVLLLTAAFGEGHNAAARSLQAALHEHHIQTEVLDLFSKAHPTSYDQSRRTYLRLVNETPSLWAAFYHVLHRIPLERWFAFCLASLRNELLRALHDFRPTVVVSVYPLYSALFESLFCTSLQPLIPKPRFYTVVTDSITINAIWYRSGQQPLLLPNPDTLNVLTRAGVLPSRLHVSGFPVSPRFAEPIEPRPDPADTARPKVLFMVNGQPERALALVQTLHAENRYDLTITVGRDTTLRHKLVQLHAHDPHPPAVLGWVDNVPALMRSHHVLIGKAGGATVQETLAATTPMLMTQIFPGQEEGNAQLLIERDCGAFCPTPESVIRTLQVWFDNQATRWKQLHQNTLQLARPNAANDIVRQLLTQPDP